jgi:hypothetical protein
MRASNAPDAATNCRVTLNSFRLKSEMQFLAELRESAEVSQSTEEHLVRLEEREMRSVVMTILVAMAAMTATLFMMNGSSEQVSARVYVPEQISIAAVNPASR